MQDATPYVSQYFDKSTAIYFFRDPTSMGWGRVLVASALCAVLRFSDAQELNVDLVHSRFSYAPRLAKTPFMILAEDETSTKSNLETALLTTGESLNAFWTQQLPRLVNKGVNGTTTASASYSRAVPYVSACLDDFSKLFLTLGKDGVSLGFRAVDALGKPGSDILDGNIYMYGSLDECLDIGRRVKYWLAPVALVEIEPPKPKPLVAFEMGMCVPESCNKMDLQYFVNLTNEVLYNKTDHKYLLFTNTEDLQTTESKRLPFSNGAIVMITVCAIFFTLVAAASVADGMLMWLASIAEQPNTGLFAVNADAETRSMSTTERTPLLGQSPLKPKQDIRQSRAFEFLAAFSLFKTVPMILSTKQPPTAITSLNGIRVLSMFWVILGHTFVWVSMLGLLKNPAEFMATVPRRFSFQAIFGGTFSVDSFFFLSGTLVAYLTLREMEKKKGRFPFLTYYLHRYLRLTMVYGFLLFFWWTLTVYFGNGHWWNAFVGHKSVQMQSCEKYWWTNLLYINNFYPWRLNAECMGWSWYLANDMQFYVLAPLIIIPLYYFSPVGLVVTGLFLIASAIANGVIATNNGYTASYNLPTNVTNDGESDDIYVKPYCRVPPYLVGLILGFLIYKKVRFPLHWILNYVIYSVIWLLSAGLCFAVVYGLYNTWHGHILTEAQNITYFMFSRFAWGLGLALMVFACHNGYGCVINDFLSMKFWIPLSRLTYTAYLVHPIVLTVLYGTARDTFTYTDYKVASMIVSNVVLSYGVAGVVAAFVEFPLSNLEMAVFKLVGLKQRESARMVAGQREEEQGREPNPPNTPPSSSVLLRYEKPSIREPNH